MEAPAPLPLLSATVAHEYFAGEFTDFVLHPLPATAVACRRLGLRLLRNGATLTLTVTANTMQQITAAAYQPALAATALCWEIAPTDDEFSAFTGLDFTGANQALVFTNQSNDAKGGSLTASATASAGDLWPRQGLCFDLRPPRPLRPGSIVSLETDAGTVLRDIVVTDPSLVAIDTTDSGSGLYRATQDGRPIANWFADERMPSKPSTGATLVLSGELLAAAFSHARGNMMAEPALPAYSATFPARPVIWRYHIFNAQAGENLSIVPVPIETSAPGGKGGPPVAAKSRKPAGRAAAAFVPVTDPLLPTAQSFEAVRPFKLAEDTPQRFALNSGTTTRYSPLPVAGFSFARSIRNAALCSDIFVYL